MFLFLFQANARPFICAIPGAVCFTLLRSGGADSCRHFLHEVEPMNKGQASYYSSRNAHKCRRLYTHASSVRFCFSKLPFATVAFCCVLAMLRTISLAIILAVPESESQAISVFHPYFRIFLFLIAQIRRSASTISSFTRMLLVSLSAVHSVRRCAIS